ncbi:putative leucine-rich repeat receptor-like protein kinase [Dorcoceras hygrometricum]|uniref:Putative leucine-rich repeat receptor-like protein kinase n=1 Tax=Dorcoceras hygrometricum TaxID=472368 RepID=A0A2Z7AKS9_9LAMI|nr:putative leucine-rich repeat receptor-like protein kinase [Dorcoceras hygrometricum]
MPGNTPDNGRTAAAAATMLHAAHGARCARLWRKRLRQSRRTAGCLPPFHRASMREGGAQLSAAMRGQRATKCARLLATANNRSSEGGGLNELLRFFYFKTLLKCFGSQFYANFSANNICAERGRLVSLEDFDGYRTSANTHPHKQHLYGLLDSLTSHADFAADYKYRKDVFELLHKASSLQTQSNDI